MQVMRGPLVLFQRSGHDGRCSVLWCVTDHLLRSLNVPPHPGIVAHQIEHCEADTFGDNRALHGLAEIPVGQPHGLTPTHLRPGHVLTSLKQMAESPRRSWILGPMRSPT